MSRPSTALSASLVLLAVVALGVILPMAGTSSGAAFAAACMPAAPGADPSASTGPTGQWNNTQVGHVATIVAVGQQRAVPPRGWVIAVAVAMQESTLRNLGNLNVPASYHHNPEGFGSDHDSVGVFQQRPLPPDGAGSWGTVAELMTPSVSASKFYSALSRVDRWDQMRLTEAAQAVQRSAYPDAYQKWEHDANTLVAQVAGIASIDTIGGSGIPGAPCGAANLPPVPVGPGGWVQPVRAAVGSGFRTPDRPTHDGVDLSAARHTPIRAAAAGVVIVAQCNSSIGTCDVDGGVNGRGCGWYIDVRHSEGQATRYCHMVRRPDVQVGQTVQAGQVIGFVGSSGHSSGPHLHFQVHVNVGKGQYPSSSDAVDPVAWMQRAGAPLGAR